MPNCDHIPGSFYLKAHLSPTYYNLKECLLTYGWKSTRSRLFADFSDKNLRFDEEASTTLEHKHKLANLISKHCPQIMPLTYCVNDHNWPAILNKLDENFYHGKDSKEGLIWILKPALLNNGQAIKILRTLSELEGHFLSSNRFGGEHVLQQYITNPHLLRDDRKYSIRQFVIITNYAGAYLYPQGYLNIALKPYTAHNFSDLNPHLTNEHLHGYEPNVLQIPTDRFTWFDNLFPQIQTILIELIAALKKQYPAAFTIQKHKTFALFGMDFMMDSNNKVWLLEANHGPCFPVDINHPLQSYLYKHFWHAIVNGFVFPIANRCAGKTGFLRLDP